VRYGRDLASSTKVIFFIDGSNIFWGLQNYRRTKEQVTLDYGKLVTHLAGTRIVRGRNYYCSTPEVIGESQAKFLDWLRKNEISVISKTLKHRINPHDGRRRSVEKGVDVALVTDLLSLAWEGAYDDAVLVSGDADYTKAVERVRDKGKMVEVVAWRDSLSRELKNAAPKIIYLDDIIDIVKVPPTTSPPQ
jgi:uncharacterized LabA/DUF88 family protein